MNYVIAAIISIILSVLIIPKIRDLYIEHSKPLEIKPAYKNISATKGQNIWNQEFFIYLINHSKNPYYDINISSEFPKGITVSILPEKSDIITIGSTESGISMGVDFMLNLENIEKGTGSTQTVINNIDPNETKKIKVSVSNNNSQNNFNMKFVLGKFSTIPKQILKSQ